jgi:ribosome-binding factor A
MAMRPTEQKTMSEVKRPVRVAERVKEELAVLISREVRDPRAAGAIITRVEMTDDLKLARVYIRTLDGTGGAEVVEGLSRASSMLRREVTNRVKMRYAPELRFFYDDRLDKVTRIEELLEEVKKDRK